MYSFLYYFYIIFIKFTRVNKSFLLKSVLIKNKVYLCTIKSSKQDHRNIKLELKQPRWLGDEIKG